MAMKIQVVD